MDVRATTDGNRRSEVQLAYMCAVPPPADGNAWRDQCAPHCARARDQAGQASQLGLPDLPDRVHRGTVVRACDSPPCSPDRDKVCLMPALRRDIVDDQNPGVYHCISRCVRRESLLSSPARRQWLVRRLEQLAQVLAIDVVSFAVMENHLHLLIRIRPDIVRSWSDREVARRRVAILPNRRTRSRSGRDPDGAPSEQEVAAILASPALLDRARRDLSNLGFFHRLLKEPCARAWNKEDGVTGHFWEGRFHSPRVLDDASLLRVSRYIELNEVRARAADSIPGSIWSSACAQWNRLVSAVRGMLRDRPESAASALAKVTWEPVFPCTPPKASARRPGTRPFAGMEIPLVDYVLELDLIGRMRHPRKPGFISAGKRCLADELEALLGSGGQALARIRGELQIALSSRLRHLIGPSPHGSMQTDHRRYGSCYGDTVSVAREALRRGARRVIPISIVE